MPGGGAQLGSIAGLRIETWGTQFHATADASIQQPEAPSQWIGFPPMTSSWMGHLRWCAVGLNRRSQNRDLGTRTNDSTAAGEEALHELGVEFAGAEFWIGEDFLV